ncbi:MAG: hypothetical protein KZQ93_15355 [Candidatus Thiodiazotropha sp. (ex Monitilora ramsayi)]|nr:hypothetical protein [Candidatus Thiodiazotropha sp. (ex Monitilora ramsayi)]
MTRTANHRQLTLVLSTDDGSAVPSAVLDDPRIEPAFLETDITSPPVDDAAFCEKLKAHYARAIARTPAALRLHVARIELYVVTTDTRVPGALLDLFLTLKEKGFPLRRRMLAISKSLLTPHDLNLFLTGLQKGEINLTADPPEAVSSILRSGITGDTRLVEKSVQVASNATDPLTIAQEYLEYGQVELAQEILERSLLAAPNHEALHHALLEIYRHTRQLAPVNQMWGHLQGLDIPVKAEWQALLSQLSEDHQQV